MDMNIYCRKLIFIWNFWNRQYFQGLILNPVFFDDKDVNRYMKVSITNECHAKSQEELEEIEGDIKAEISDLINYYFVGSFDLYEEIRKLNFEPEILNW